MGWSIPRAAGGIWGTFCGENEGKIIFGNPQFGVGKALGLPQLLLPKVWGWGFPRVVGAIWGSFCGENVGKLFLGILDLGWEREDLPALDFSFWSFRNCCRKLPSFTNLLDTEASFSEPSSLSGDRKTEVGIWELPSPSHVGLGTGKIPGIGNFPKESPISFLLY